MQPWKILDSSYLVNAPWLKVAKEKCELENGKIIDDFYTIWQPAWVLILARTANGCWVMVKQYRHGTKKIELEFPAGIINKNETPVQAALRELQEESGYACISENENVYYIDEFPVNPDRHRSVYHVVFIDNVTPNGSTNFDSNENIETLLLSDSDLQKAIASGSFKHPLQIAGYFKYKLSLKV